MPTPFDFDNSQFTVANVGMTVGGRNTIRSLYTAGLFKSHNQVLSKSVKLLLDWSFRSADALRSKVPIATGQLRDQMIKTSVVVDAERTKGRVYILASRHTASWPKLNKGKLGKPGSAQLARYLDDQPNPRSQESRAQAGFSPSSKDTSSGWIDEAFDEFYDKKAKWV
jgi:hypothetical protein